MITRSYEFKKIGGSINHCTYCPKQPNEPCSLSCQSIYDAVNKERETDGVKVNDEPNQ